MRPPPAWMSDACTDGDPLAEELAAMPMQLLGCQRMLCVLGPTYIEQLSCLLEIVVFMHVRAHVDASAHVFLARAPERPRLAP